MLSKYYDYMAAIKTYLQSNYNIYLAAIEAEYDAGLRNVENWINGFKDPYTINLYPALMIFPENIPFDGFTLSAYNNRTVIDLIIAETIGERDGLTMLHYASAMQNLITNDFSLGGNVEDCNIMAIRHFPPESNGIGVINVQIEISKEIQF